MDGGAAVRSASMLIYHQPCCVCSTTTWVIWLFGNVMAGQSIQPGTPGRRMRCFARSILTSSGWYSPRRGRRDRRSARRSDNLLIKIWWRDRRNVLRGRIWLDNKLDALVTHLVNVSCVYDTLRHTLPAWTTRTRRAQSPQEILWVSRIS